MPTPIDGYAPTSLSSWNELIGGLPAGSMLGLTGPPKAGKSILCTQLCMEALAYYEGKGNALYIDTEGDHHRLRAWVPIFNKRYGTDVQLIFLETGHDAETGQMTVFPRQAPEKKRPTVYVADIRFIEDLLAFFGRGVHLTMSEKTDKVKNADGEEEKVLRGGKFSIRPVMKEWQRDIWDSPIGRFVSKNNIKFLAIDSVTNPTQEFGTERENFPARANATNLLLLRAQLLTERLDLITVSTMHQSINPADPWARPDVVGGKAVLSNFKFLTYVQHKRDMRTPSVKKLQTAEEKAEKRPPTQRDIWIMRHPARQDWVRPIHLNLGTEGFEEVGKSEATAVEEPVASVKGKRGKKATQEEEEN